MKQCKCEHWQECPVCQPSRFDADGNRLPPEPTPLQAARAQIEKDTALLRQALEALESAIPWIVTDRNTFAEVVRARHFQREDTETDESILSGYDAVIDDAEKATTALRAALAEPDHIPDAGKMVAEPCEMGAICLNCQPRGPNGECPDAPKPRRNVTYVCPCCHFSLERQE